MDLFLVIAGGLFSLAGVLLGGLLAPLTQLFIESQRDRRAAGRAKLLIAGELLHAQMILRVASEGEHWPPVEDVSTFIPTSAWQENKSNLAGKISENLWNQLIMAYALLETDRRRFAMAYRLPAETLLPAEVAAGLKEASNKLGRLRRSLGGGGGWLDEIHDELRPRIDGLNEHFITWLDGLSTDDLKNDKIIAKTTQVAQDLGELNREFGDKGAWATKIKEYLKRRLQE